MINFAEKYRILLHRIFQLRPDALPDVLRDAVDALSGGGLATMTAEELANIQGAFQSSTYLKDTMQ